jgi:hypothetical protein
MFAFLRDPMQLLSIWICVAAAALFAIPWGPFGWAELAALVGPLILGVDRRIRREVAFALGLPSIALLCILEPSISIVPRLLVAWSVYAMGLLLTARMIEGFRELETIAGHVAFAPTDNQSFDAFQANLEREFGRARRHEHTFALLSVAAHPRSIEVDAAGPYTSQLLRELAENRSRLELHELLVGELHVYADVVAARNRVLALVPEIDAPAAEVLVRRLQGAVQKELDFEAQFGVACFPRDAICLDDLIQAADQDRTSSRLRRLPEPKANLQTEEPDDLAREIQS